MLPSYVQTARTHTGCTAAVQLLASWQLISRFFSLHILTNNNHLKLFLHQTPIKTFPPFYESHFHMWTFLSPFVKEVNEFFFFFLRLLLRSCSFEWFQDLAVNCHMAVPSKKVRWKLFTALQVFSLHSSESLIITHLNYLDLKNRV